MRHLALVLALCVGCGSTPPPARRARQDAAYPIVLERPSRAGLRYAMRTLVTIDHSLVYRAHGEIVDQSALRGELAIDVHMEVREVDGRGRATRSEGTVDRAVWHDAQADREMLPAGTRLIVTANETDEGGTIEREGGTLDGDQRTLLHQVFTVRTSPSSDDEMLGSETPRAVGASWGVNTRLTALDLDRQPQIDMGDGSLTGSVRLRAREPVGGIPCLRVEAHMHANGFRFVAGDAATLSSSAELVHESWLPTETRRLKRRDRNASSFHVELRARDSDGAEVYLTVSSDSDVRSEYAYENER